MNDEINHVPFKRAGSIKARFVHSDRNLRRNLMAERVEQTQEQLKAAADAVVMQLAVFAVQAAEESQDPRIKAIEQVCIAQVGNNIRELIKMVGECSSPPPKDAMQMAKENQQKMVTESSEAWRNVMASQQASSAATTDMLNTAVKSLLEEYESKKG